jgi:phosphatidylglycerophosphate synthase
MQIRFKLAQIPWAMAAGRALLGPVVIVGEACGWSGVGLASMVVTALLSDIFDGVLARRWGCDSAGVRLFDSMSDTVFYLCVAIAIAIGHPQVWRENAGLLVALMGLEATRLVLEFAKFGKPASYHSYLAKAWGLVMAMAVVGVFAWPGARALVPVALVFGIACNVEGLAMTLMLPVWHRDVKTLRAAWLLRKELRGGCGRKNRAATVTAAAVVALCMLAAPAFALEPGQAAYAGGTAKIALDTPGTLDATSPAELVFTYKEPNGTPGEIRVAYAKIRSFEPRQDVVRHLGFLPALGAGLVAARQRRHTITISYVDSSDAIQVAIFQVAERDQLVLKGILRARSPQSCMVMPYNACASNPVTRPAAMQAAAPTPGGVPAPR